MKSSIAQFAPVRPYSIAAERTELLPFRIRLAETAQDLQKVVEIRASAYSRHIPKLGEALREAEPEDYQSDVLLLIAERKLDRQAVGTLRLQPNVSGPLRMEGEATLPVAFHGKRLVETTRLGIENGTSGTMVMAALVKAAFEICHACDIHAALAVGRRSMAAVFRSMCYDVVDGPVVFSYARHVPFWILAMPILEVETRLRAKGHAYLEFMARTEHPDIRIDWERVFTAFDR